MIGSKTLGAIVLLALALGVATASGSLSVEHLSSISAEACLIIGVFAGLATPLATLGWRPTEPSQSGLRLGARADAEQPWDAPALVQRATFVMIFVCLGLVAFGNREAALLTSVPTRIVAADSSYCPPPGTELASAAVPAPEPVADVHGCALIKRAYKLGYTKSLGACAPKKAAESSPEARRVPVCEKRQRDEPYWHWTWRQFDRNSGDLDLDPIASARRQADEFHIRMGYVETSIAQQGHAINADPRAAHHIFTNLPAPSRPSWLAQLIAPTPCHTRYRELPAYPASNDPSVVFEHALARLLFDGSLGTAVGFCHDYTIHWGARDDLCQKLVGDPRTALDDQGILDRVRAVLDRRERQRELRALARDLGRHTAIAKPAPASAIVSFQCYISGSPRDADDTRPPPRRLTRTQIRVDGVELTVRELVLGSTPSGGPRLSAYTEVFQLLVGDTYSGAAGDLDLSGQETPSTPTEVLATDLRLLRMEMLRDEDPFVGGDGVGRDWASGRAELRDTYPLHFHLGNFTEVFRNRYRRERGRL